MNPTTYPDGAFRHDLLLHDGRAELVDLMVPFLRDGSADGDRVVVVGDPDFVDALLSSAPDVAPAQVRAESATDRYPARDLHRFERLLAELHSPGSWVRVVNQMPTMTSTAQWHEWRRYEAAANVVLASYQVWGTCAYDIGDLDARMLADLHATHPFVQTHGRRRPSAEYDRSGGHAGTYLDVPPHPAESTEPTLSLEAPTAAAARRAVRDLAIRSGVSATGQEAVILAASEAVTNASIHGRPPVLLRAWSAPDGRVTVAVSDAGPGPDPLVGLLPEPADSASGRGMWMVHLLLRDVHHRRSDDGYTITFSVDPDTPAG